MTEEQKRKNKNLAGILIGAGVIGLIFGLMAIIGSGASNSSTPVTTPVDNSVQGTNTQTVPTSTSPQTSFGNGTFIVGTDIQPGTYRITAGSNCYYARLSGFGGTSGEIIANANTNGSGAIVTIKPSDAGFQSSGCATWTMINTPQSSATNNSKVQSVNNTPAPATTQSQSQARTPATQPVVAQATWHTAFTYSNSVGFITTQPFNLQGSQWRITVSCNPTENEGPGTTRFTAYINSVASGGSDGVAADSYCTQNPNVSYLYNNDPGQYALQVASVNSTYIVTIEDYY
jgi:hypothetical protein